jgi:Uma2 family endonuclease
LRYYAGFTRGVWSYPNSTVILGDDDQPQPDHTLRILDGGSSHLSERSYTVGPPELVAEVSFTSLRNDVGIRREMFQRHGVQEYLVWRVEEQTFAWWRLLDGEYVEIEADSHGVLRSEVFPRLWLDTRAMIGDDVPGILATLNAGLASPEHADFQKRKANGAT